MANSYRQLDATDYRDPFRGWDRAEMDREVNRFIEETGLRTWEREIRYGAYLEQDPETDIDDDECRRALDLEREKENSPYWLGLPRLPWRVYALVICCSLGAVVQGWDETAINGGLI